MAKDKLTDYSATAASNTDIGGININEGMLPSNVNNAMREQLSHLADFAAGTSGVNVLKFQDDTDTNSIKIQAPAAVTTTTTLTLPDGAGSANQSLTTNGSGALSWSTRIGNVVEDTTPQLGGNLDVNGNDINFGDNDKATFGAGDLQIYHDGIRNYIDSDTTELRLQTSELRMVNSANTEIGLKAVEDGAVTLYYDATPKLATTASGIDVQGSLTADGLTVDGTDTEAAGSELLKVRNSTTGEAVTVGLYAKADNGGDGNSGSITFDAGADGVSANNQLRFSADHQTDTNPALSIAGNGDISFYDSTGVTQGLFWDASTQRLGLGTTTPDKNLVVAGASSEIVIDDTSTSIPMLRFRDNGSTNARIYITGGDMRFDTNGTTERMRIDSSGYMWIKSTGGTNPWDATSGTFAKLGDTYPIGATAQSAIVAILNRNTTTGTLIECKYNGNVVGSISVTGSSTAYNTSSDYRLKENVVADWDATTRLKQLNPVRFNFIADADTTVDGFLAHEVQDVVPEAISGTKDEVDDEGNPVYQGIDQSKLVPLLVKTIQELEARIAALEAN